MATTAAPYGAVPIGTLSSAGSFTGRTRQIGIASGYTQTLFYGDFVKLVTAGTVELDAGTATLTPIGIFLGCSYSNAEGQKLFSKKWPASQVSSDAVAYVLDDPFVLFQMQADDTLAVSSRGANTAVVQTDGNTTIGMSKNAVDASEIANTNTLPLRIIDFVDGPDSAAGDTYTDVICMFNVGHAYLNTTGLA